MRAESTINATCRDGCGRSIDDDKPEQAGWHFLAITERWRCPACSRELDDANQSARLEASDTQGG